MSPVILIALLSRFHTVLSACGHVWYYPTEMCLNSEDGYSEESWEISCEGDSYQVLFWDNSDCSGAHNTTRTMDIAAGDDICSGNNACECGSPSDCDIFQWEISFSCTDIQDEATSSSAVLLNACIGWPHDDNSTYLYHKWSCNGVFNDNPQSVDDLPITYNIYTDEECTVEYSYNYYGDYADYNYSYYQYSHDQCESTHELECEWKSPTAPDLGSCSHFNHFPINECGHEFHHDTFYDGYTYDEVAGGYRRRRLLYGSSSKYTCSRNSENIVAYSQHFYDDDSCSGAAIETVDVTAECVEDACYCNAVVGGEGDSESCTIAKNGWSYHCDDVLEDYYYSLYVTDICIANESFSCFPDYDVFKRQYTDEQCVTPMHTECWYQDEIICNVNDLTDTSVTNGCGYVIVYGTTYAMDVCYGRSHLEPYYNDSSSYKYYCDAQGNVFKSYSWATDNCSDSGATLSTNDITWSCTNDNSYECVCGEGSLCNLAKRVNIDQCDGDNWSSMTDTQYYVMDTCVADTEYGFFTGHSCADGELSETIYNDAECTDIRSECVSNNDYYESDANTCVTNTNGGECGYVNGYPLNVCSSGYSSMNHKESYMYYCDTNGNFWEQKYFDLDCSNASTYDWDTFNATNYCYDKDECHCVVDSQCSYYESRSSDSCYEEASFHAIVVGVCRGNGDEYEPYYWSTSCTADGDMDYKYYVDSECNVEETYDYVYDSHNDASEWSEEGCDISVSYTRSLCGGARDHDASGGNNEDDGDNSNQEPATTNNEDGDDDTLVDEVDQNNNAISKKNVFIILFAVFTAFLV